MAETTLIAGIDAGGTTFKVGIANPDGALLGKRRVATTAPAETIDSACAALRRLAEEAGGRIEALGVASFGPVDVDPGSQDYGCILNTPKKGWSGARLKPMFEERLGAPVVLDTDVNAALLAETAQGAACGASKAAYVTIGTGVGVGIVIDDALVGKPFHPELGHICVTRHEIDIDYPGVCKIHGSCLEGLLSAPALIDRFGPLENLSEDDYCWEIAGWYLAQLCLTLTLCFRLERIVLGGGVMNAPALVRNTRQHFSKFLNGYLINGETDPERLIVRAKLGDDAGLAGALQLVRAVK